MFYIPHFGCVKFVFNTVENILLIYCKKNVYRNNIFLYLFRYLVNSHLKSVVRLNRMVALNMWEGKNLFCYFESPRRWLWVNWPSATSRFPQDIRRSSFGYAEVLLYLSFTVKPYISVQSVGTLQFVLRRRKCTFSASLLESEVEKGVMDLFSNWLGHTE